MRSGDFIIPLLELFAFLTLVIVIAGHVIWLLERQRDADFPKSYVKGVWEGIWWAAVTVTTVGYGDKTPRGIFGRTFGLIWMFAGLFIIANFTANVTSRLTVEQIEGAINGPQDLPGKIVVTVEGQYGCRLADAREHLAPHGDRDRGCLRIARGWACSGRCL